MKVTLDNGAHLVLSTYQIQILHSLYYSYDELSYQEDSVPSKEERILEDLGLVSRNKNTYEGFNYSITNVGVKIYRDYCRSAYSPSYHDEIISSLCKFYALQDYIVWADIGLKKKKGPCKETDVLAIKAKPKNFESITIEVKTSVSDFLGDIKDKSKRACYISNSNKFYYAVPRNLVSVKKIPAEAGLIYWDQIDGGEPIFGVEKESPIREMSNLDPRVWVGLVNKRPLKKADLNRYMWRKY